MRYDDLIQIIDMVDSGVIMLDENYRIVYWNKFVSDTSLIPFETIKDKHWLDVFPELKDKRIAKAVKKAIQFKFPSILSYKLLRNQFPLYKKSLATKPPYLIVQSVIMKPLVEDGQSKGCIIYINDVSAASKREEALNEQSVELRNVLHSYAEVKNQFEAVFESAHNGIVVFDHNGTIVNANSAASALFYKLSDSIIGEDISDLLPEIRQNYWSEESGSFVYNANEEHEFEQSIDDIHLWVSISQMGRGESLDSYFFVFISDISEIKFVQEKLLTANSELEEFAYRTSHDLRSPIVSSVGLMKVARESLGSGDSARVSACLEHADKSLRKLELLIRDILKLTETQKMEESIQEIDVSSLVDEALSSMEQLNGDERVNVEMDISHARPLFSKKHRFNMILENLLSNSIKYSDPDEPNPFIKVHTYSDHNRFIMDVSDNGLGIPEANEKQLFKMFNRFHPKTAFGSGLGLYLMKKSAQVLGGDISYIKQQKGACFRLEIPFAVAEDQSALAISSSNVERSDV